MTDETTEPKQRKPRTPKAVELPGFTQVGAGTNEIVAAARKWDESQIAIEKNSMYVKNEFINWDHFRSTGEYIPASEGVTQSADLNGVVADPNAVAAPTLV